MNDRELLELAAKADGWANWDWLAGDGILNVYAADGTHVLFDPLNDDGDALRLAVKLGIVVCVDYELGYCGIHLPRCRGKYDLMEELGRDPYAATRLAIVRAAAEIGKAMP